MKTLKSIPANWQNSDNKLKALAFIVDQQTGGDLAEKASDICNYGASGGVSGFIYYAETCKFYQDYKETIWDLLYDTAESMGESVLQMIANFGGAKDVGSGDQLENLLAWFALEEAARYVSEYEADEQEEDEE